MGPLYAALGSAVEIVELSVALLPGVDADLVRPVRKGGEALRRPSSRHRSDRIEALPKELRVHLGGAGAASTQLRFRMLVAIRATAEREEIGAAIAGVRGSSRPGASPSTNVSDQRFAHFRYRRTSWASRCSRTRLRIREDRRLRSRRATCIVEAAAIRLLPNGSGGGWIGLPRRTRRPRNLGWRRRYFNGQQAERLSLGRDEGLTS